MIPSLLTTLLFFRLTTATISVQAFSDANCAGATVGSNVQPNGANLLESSGCIASSTYNSINILRADAGFICDFFEDPLCQVQVAGTGGTGNDPLGCFAVTGQGITCKSLDKILNPLAGTTGTVTIGSSKLVADVGGDAANHVRDAVLVSCGDTGCDPNTPAVHTFQRLTQCFRVVGETGIANLDVCEAPENCVQRTTLTGNYDNLDQRQYMADLLGATMEAGRGAALPNSPRSDRPCEAPCAVVHDQLSFAQIVINDEQGANLADVSPCIDRRKSTIAMPGLS
jgi:hypothetical protein